MMEVKSLKERFEAEKDQLKSEIQRISAELLQA